MIASIALNAFIICIERDYLVDAKYFEKQISRFYFDESEIYERLIYTYARSFMNLKSRQILINQNEKDNDLR
ncbi:MAG: hypothetical protein ACLR70_06825 [Streptococcus thermophilus]